MPNKTHADGGMAGRGLVGHSEGSLGSFQLQVWEGDAKSLHTHTHTWMYGRA